MSIEYFLRLVLRYLYVPLVGVALGLLAASSYASIRGGYESSALVLVTPPAAVADRLASHPERFVLTQEKVVTSDAIVSAAADSLGNVSPRDLERALTVEGGVTDDTMAITSRGDTPEQSRERVDAIAAAYSAAAGKNDVEVLRVDAAEPSVSRTKVLSAGGIVGLAIGLAALLLIGFLRRPVLGTSAWLDDERYGSVFPYRVKTKARRRGPAGPERALLSWILGGTSSPHSPASTVVVHGVPDSAEAERLAEWLRVSAGRSGRAGATSDSSSTSTAEAAPSSRPSTEADAGGPDSTALSIQIWHAAADSVPTSGSAVRVFAVKQGSPLRTLEQMLQLTSSDRSARIVIID